MCSRPTSISYHRARSLAPSSRHPTTTNTILANGSRLIHSNATNFWRNCAPGHRFQTMRGIGLFCPRRPGVAKPAITGVSFAGASLALRQDYENITSVLRLELPWNLLDTVDVERLVEFFARTAATFPFCVGHAGMSFIHTISYVPEAREEIYKLWRRFLGFDSAHDAARLVMRKKSPPAHWLNLVDDERMKALGGEEKLRSELEGCVVTRLGAGLLIRAAKFPPVVDVNRQGLDIGRLPTVARALQPIRFVEGLFAGLQDADAGKDWLERFDQLDSSDWDNG